MLLASDKYKTVLFCAENDSELANAEGDSDSVTTANNSESNRSVDIKENVEARCVTCTDVKKGNISSTGNFFKHYETKHPLKLKEMKVYTKIKDVNTNCGQQSTIEQMMPTMG